MFHLLSCVLRCVQHQSPTGLQCLAERRYRATPVSVSWSAAVPAAWWTGPIHPLWNTSSGLPNRYCSDFLLVLFISRFICDTNLKCMYNCNVDGCGVGEGISVQTFEAKPKALDPPELRAAGAAVIEVQWNPPHKPNGVITAYFLYRYTHAHTYTCYCANVYWYIILRLSILLTCRQTYCQNSRSISLAQEQTAASRLQQAERHQPPPPNNPKQPQTTERQAPPLHVIIYPSGNMWNSTWPSIVVLHLAHSSVFPTFWDAFLLILVIMSDHSSYCLRKTIWSFSLNIVVSWEAHCKLQEIYTFYF